MPVYIHLANLFIKKSAVENKYEGGIVKFREDFFIGGDNYNQEDNELFSIAKMNTDEFDLDYLISNGLDYEVNLHTSIDFTIKSRYGDYEWQCDWINDNNLFAWHINANANLIAKAIALGNLTKDKIEEMFEKKENPFATII